MTNIRTFSLREMQGPVAVRRYDACGLHLAQTPAAPAPAKRQVIIHGLERPSIRCQWRRDPATGSLDRNWLSEPADTSPMRLHGKG